MIHKEHNPALSWRNHKRITFIKGFYRSRKMIQDILQQFEKYEIISHDAIDTLLETQLRSLKDLSHALYRMQDDELVNRQQQRVFDKILGTLWHELDKSRDNIRLLEAYVGLIEAHDDAILKRVSQIDSQVLRAAKRDLPAQFRRAKQIMDQLVPLFEDILPVYKDNEVVIRSIFFARDELDDLCEPNTVEYFFERIFGAVEIGYDVIIRSLLSTRHDYQALLVYQEFKQWVMDHPNKKPVLFKLEKEFGSRLHG